MRSLLALAVVPACLLPVYGQQYTPPAVIGVFREMIKEGKTAAHEKVESEYARAFRKAKFSSNYLALSSMSGPSEVCFLEAYPSFAAVEQSEKEVGKEPLKSELEALDARDGELRTRSTGMYAVYRKNMSYRPEQANIGKLRYVMISTYRVRLGREEEMVAGMKSILGALEKANNDMPFLAYQVMVGAPEGVYLFFSGMPSLNVLDEEPARQKAFMEAMGMEDFRKLMKGTGDVFASMETTLFSVSPRMSYVSKETEDVDPGFWMPKPPAKPAAPAKKTN